MTPVVVESLPFVAFAFSAGAGTFLAPCAYPLLPGYVSYYLGETTGAGDRADGRRSDEPDRADESTASGDDTATPDGGRTPTAAGPGTGPVARRVAGGLDHVVPGDYASRLVRAATVGLLVSVGFVLVYGLLAGVAAAVGSRLLGSVSLLEPIVAGVLILVGTAAAVGYDLPSPTVRLPERRRSTTGFVGFGVLYAAAAAGCTGPLFVGIAVRALASEPVVAVAIFGAYAAGMSSLMILVTVAAALGRDTLLAGLGARGESIERVMGVLLVVAGLAQLYYFLFVFGGLDTLGL